MELSRLQFRPNHPGAKVAETLFGDPLLKIAGKNRAQFREQLIAFDHVLVQAIQASARLIAAEINLVFVGPFAYEGNLRHVRPRASIWAAGHPNNEFFWLEIKLLQESLNTGRMH